MSGTDRKMRLVSLLAAPAQAPHEFVKLTVPLLGFVAFLLLLCSTVHSVKLWRTDDEAADTSTISQAAVVHAPAHVRQENNAV